MPVFKPDDTWMELSAADRDQAASKHTPWWHLLAVALVCSLPHWSGILQNRGDYTPFSVSPQVSAITFDESHAYAPPAERFYLTGKLKAETDNFEHRDFSAGIPAVPALILGGMAHLSGDLENAFVLADCIFPPALFLLFFLVARQFILNRHAALFIAWSTLIVPFGFWNSLWLGDDPLIAPLEVTRTPQPELSFLLLFGTAVLLGSALKQSRSIGLLVATAVCSGALVYTYYFFAVAWGLALSLLCIAGIVWKRRDLSIISVGVLIAMALIAVPYLTQSMQGRAEGGQSFLLERMGLYTHQPHWFALVAAAGAISILLAFGKRFAEQQPVFIVLATVIPAALFGMNFQVISGYETQSWHFWKRLALPIFFFVATAWLARFTTSRLNDEKFKKFATVCRAATIVLVLGTSARLIHAGIATAPFQKASGAQVAMLTWIRSHVPENHVIGTTDPELILMIPALTADYTYVPSGLRSLTSLEEIKDRYFELSCLLGLSVKEMAQAAAVPSHLRHSTEVLQVLGLSYTGDREVYQEFVNEYATRPACPAPKRRLDYLLIPRKVGQPSAVAHLFPEIQLVYRDQDYDLLKLRAH
jgi:hypothetical protein